jgi:hypothetical protein
MIITYKLNPLYSNNPLRKIVYCLKGNLLNFSPITKTISRSERTFLHNLGICQLSIRHSLNLQSFCILHNFIQKSLLPKKSFILRFRALYDATKCKIVANRNYSRIDEGNSTNILPALKKVSNIRKLNIRKQKAENLTRCQTLRMGGTVKSELCTASLSIYTRMNKFTRPKFISLSWLFAIENLNKFPTWYRISEWLMPIILSFSMVLTQGLQIATGIAKESVKGSRASRHKNMIEPCSFKLIFLKLK